MDLEKAFDIVVTVKSLLQAVKSLYRDHSARVRVGAGMALV